MTDIVKINHKKLITMPADEAITKEVVSQALKLHLNLIEGYKENEDLYLSKHKILTQKNKESYKPDNRIILNYAKYIVDTFVGYQMGIPVKITHEIDSVANFVDNFRKFNDMEDSEFELSKLADIFGHSFIYLYQDEDGNTCMTYESPLNMFIVHSDSVKEEPLFSVRYNKLANDSFVGEVITKNEQIEITANSIGDVTFKDEGTPHIYSDLPVIELIENDERQGLFDSVKTLINALNKTVSEKANDVDYFADAYLKITGVELSEDVSQSIRSSRIINLYSNDGTSLNAEFLEKPNADVTQENLIALLIKSIFDISMIANLANEDFGNSSGTALAFKLQPMSNLAKIKNRKMQSAFNRMYRIVFSVPKTSINKDDWRGLNYKFTENMPRNILEEAQIVKLLDGQVSEKTKLSVLSIIQNVKDEIKALEKEEEDSSTLANTLAERTRMDDKSLSDRVVNDEQE